MAEPPGCDADWSDFVREFRSGARRPDGRWNEIFGPIQSDSGDGVTVVGQIGQSLDGRIATESGHSKYINGEAGLCHLHRLRALVDAVVVGIGTALADDPQLTVRRVPGAHPARVVIDPAGRLPATARMYAADGVRRIRIIATGTPCPAAPGVETLVLPAGATGITPQDILAALAGLGLCRILIEGGANTVSRFLLAGCLDRLHVVVAPIVLGSGRASFVFPAIERADQAMCMTVRNFTLDNEVLFDCDLSRQRIAIGRAKKST